jgi:hypothetical protein
MSTCSLDARLGPHHNVPVKGRLIVIMLALAVLAFAGIHRDDQAATTQGQSNAASGQLAGPPAPEPDVPAIVAAVTTSATIQTHLVAESQRPLRPALSVVTVSPHLPVVPHSTARPRVFPLLI